jgi:hypothetical protein
MNSIWKKNSPIIKKFLLDTETLYIQVNHAGILHYTTIADMVLNAKTRSDRSFHKVVVGVNYCKRISADRFALQPFKPNEWTTFKRDMDFYMAENDTSGMLPVSIASIAWLNDYSQLKDLSTDQFVFLDNGAMMQEHMGVKCDFPMGSSEVMTFGLSFQVEMENEHLSSAMVEARLNIVRLLANDANVVLDIDITRDGKSTGETCDQLLSTKEWNDMKRGVESKGYKLLYEEDLLEDKVDEEKRNMLRSKVIFLLNASRGRTDVDQFNLTILHKYAKGKCL